MNPMIRIPLRNLALVIAAVAAVGLLLTPSATAEHDNNAGTVKVHDNETENPPQRNVPHVSCDFWIEGFNVNDDSGTLVFIAWPPTGNKSEVTPTGASLSWSSDEVNDMGNHHFLAGPFQLDAGHYRVEVWTDDGHPSGGAHMAKTKTFWVEPCEGEVENLPCPVGVVAVALDNGAVRLAWTPVLGAEMYNVYGASGGEDFEYLDTVTAAVYVDGTTEVGVEYEYYVTAAAGTGESVGCMSVSVVAIPMFPTALVGGIALAGAVGAYVVLRRRS